MRVNGNFRGVWLNEGEWQVRFRYSPTSFQLGALGSFMAGIILLFGAVVWGWQRFYRTDGEQSVTRSLAKNSLAPIALNLFNKLIDFGFAAFYLRLLGPAGSGSFQTAIVTAGIFDIVANFGLDILLTRDVASDRDKAPNYLLNTTVLRLGAGACAPSSGGIGTRLRTRSMTLTSIPTTPISSSGSPSHDRVSRKP